MKVLCINNSNPIHPHKLTEADMIYVGDVYTVLYAVTEGGRDFFTLKEKMHRYPYVQYLASRFIPLSNIDEKELVKEREKEEV